MENSLAQRIRELRTFYNLGVKDFAFKCGLSHVAIFHLESGKTLKPHKSSLQRIANIFGTNSDWLLFGKNEMLPNGKKELIEEGQDTFWKEEAYLEIKTKNLMLEKEIERLWQILGQFTGNSKSNFPRMLDAG